ncbi:S26 family signal peptidase [Sphingobium sp. H39-3-25]|uniref:S26 family signal peptidase n=1 Tax=Sphingobium arseniciresistens TaxID=3030834 RepID=UPI0023BA070F|nr:S26 family signal peptidase [Sphingobium arseniciresistens]
MATAVSDGGPSWRPRTQLWLLFGFFAVGSIVLSAISAWRDAHLLLINTTDSLPNWAFLIQRHKMPGRGDYVFFDPPTSALLRRHFGAKPRMFGKIVYGMPGDIISHAGREVAVNGRPVARMKPFTRFGEPLTPGVTGRVPPGCYFAATPHKDGLDSRYAEIGFVCARQVIGTGEPIL